MQVKKGPVMLPAEREVDMNQENTELFFGDEQDVVITLEVEDGTEIKVTPLASFEIEELGAEYIIAAELAQDEESMTGEVQILKYEEDEDGEASMATIEDEEEYEMAAQACRQIIKSGAIEGFDVEDDDDEDSEEYNEDYLSDIGNIFPGLSIDKGDEQ